MKLSISKHIYKTLLGYPPLKKAVGERIFPLATKNEVAFPFIVYERENATPHYDKSGASYTETSVTVYVLAEGYTESINIGEMVIDALERKLAVYPDYEVIGAVMTGATEAYTANTYVQQISFNFMIK